MELAYAIAGGGLQGTLLALAIRARQPEARIALIERDSLLGGNHLWSFHASDVPEEARALVEPLVVRRWPAYRVAFPDGARTLALPYASISSERLEAVARAALGDAVITSAPVARVSASEVELADGRVLRARRVIDARGPLTLRTQGAMAFQKFAGVELRVARAPELPTLMDACVEQRDGFRFVYLLPLAPDRVMVEDTRFSISPTLDVAQVEEDALAYAAEHGLAGELVRREHGVLPLPLDALPAPDGVLRAGYGGAFFHPTTGYSFPAALRLALHVASRPPEQALDAGYLRMVAGLRSQQRFCLLLNRLLYRAVPEAERWRVFARFHQLPEETIARFYALQMTGADRARIVCGKPPFGVSFRKAFRELRA